MRGNGPVVGVVLFALLLVVMSSCEGDDGCPGTDEYSHLQCQEMRP